MDDVLLLEKKVGETPLQCLERFRRSHKKYASTKMTYAGRLDPMADGLLIALTGDLVHKKEPFLKFYKTYECSMILGVKTDTYDILGFPEYKKFVKKSESDVKTVLKSFLGTFLQDYPPFSSKTIGGQQMHSLARSGELRGKEIPRRQVNVESISNIKFHTVSVRDLVADIIERIMLVDGDFRQEKISTAWEKIATIYGKNSIVCCSFSIDVSGGTYIRGIVHDVGKKLGCGACIWKLTRTRIGEYYLS